MATYKVIQDIEAEDKFVGPLTLKQFVFAMTGGFFGWVSFFFITTFAWGLVISLPPMLFGFFMAFPWSKVQPTDVWVLAKIQFYFKPKKRIWDQAGRQDLVTITAPKKIEKHLTKDFSQTEVKSRLKALADTIDSRGWVVKHATAADAYGTAGSTDRLFDATILPQQVVDQSYDLPDIMENTHVDQLLNDTDAQRRNQLIEQVNQARKPANQTEAIITPPSVETIKPSTKKPAERIDEMLLNEQIKNKKAAGDAGYKHMSKIGAKKPAQTTKADDSDDATDSSKDPSKTNQSKKPENEQTKDISTMTEQVSPDIINLARNNDLNVATIARQANNQRLSDEEVVISLH